MNTSGFANVPSIDFSPFGYDDENYNLPAVDQFEASSFFKTEFGTRLSDTQVFAKLDSNPELRDKMREYLIERDVKGFDMSVSDDEVLSSLKNRYSSRYDALRDIENRISEIREAEKNDSIDK